jgi:hypothetical protein
VFCPADQAKNDPLELPQPMYFSQGEMASRR